MRRNKDYKILMIKGRKITTEVLTDKGMIVFFSVTVIIAITKGNFI